MKKQFFITGSDTNIGKTYVCCALLEYFSKKNIKAIGVKPISAGNENIQQEFINRDVYEIQKSSNVDVSFNDINFYNFSEPIAPHIAAKRENIAIDFDVIRRGLMRLSIRSDILLIEGAGGYQVPLDDKRTMADLVSYLDIPIIFVVGIRLGCLNHTILSVDSIASSKQKIFGWVANIVEKDMPYVDENIEYLKKKINAPCLGILPYNEMLNKKSITNYFSWPEELA